MKSAVLGAGLPPARVTNAGAGRWAAEGRWRPSPREPRRRKVPAVNWEYLVQAAEYVRVHEQLAPLGYRVLVEDRLMDITVERDGRLLWYIEVKEKAADLPDFAERIAAYGKGGIDLALSDRGNDAQQKAKYLVRYRPQFFTLTAIGMTLDYRVTYGESTTFRLLLDIVPLP